MTPAEKISIGLTFRACKDEYKVNRIDQERFMERSGV